MCLHRDAAILDAEAAGVKHEEVEEEGWFHKYVAAKIPTSVKDNAVSKALFHVSPPFPSVCTSPVLKIWV